MREREFEYGPVARGVYIALICLVPLVGIISPGRFIPYACLLLFLGFGLRPILEVTGLYRVLIGMGLAVQDRMDRKFLAQRRRDIDQRLRDDRYRQSRSRDRDPRLPKRW